MGIGIGISGGKHATRAHIPHLTQDFDRLGLPLPVDRVGVLNGEAKHDPAVYKRDAAGGSGGILQDSVGLARA